MDLEISIKLDKIEESLKDLIALIPKVRELEKERNYFKNNSLRQLNTIAEMRNQIVVLSSKNEA